MNLEQLILARIEGSVQAVTGLRDAAPRLATIGAALLEALDAGGTIYTAGNGGSAAQASHLAEELIGRYRTDRPPCRAVCLNADPAALTCIANDYGFEAVFARQVDALARTGDALVALSTSGRSPNIVRGLESARAAGTLTVGLLGRDGGDCLDRCDHAIVVPGEDSAHIQEAHQVVIHLLCEMVEQHRARD
ncbi:MAG: D-sedoheptulose-7-phosphate isomerase [Planctomycetota bacterium]|jgi:D-sedoheptulose 7-phosphate isomerase